jgi:hypothetical protein
MTQGEEHTMKRRDMLALTAGAAIAGGGAMRLRAGAADNASTAAVKPLAITLGDDFFLSRTNPAATRDQRDLEARAIGLMQHPVIRDASDQAWERYKIMAGAHLTEEALLDYGRKKDEWAFHMLLLALNSDANYPKVLGNGYCAPHEWFGMKVPGTRGFGSGECVDNYYAFVPINGSAHFELHAKIVEPTTGDSVFATTMNLSQGTSIFVLDGRDVQKNPDGTFVLTVGPEPANGRANYLQSAPDARYLFIRNSRVDWRQKPPAYRVYRVEPPAAAPLSEEDTVWMAARMIVDDVPASYWYPQMIHVGPTNQIVGPVMSGTVGGTSLQKLGRARLALKDDEAFVITLNPGGAGYFNVICQDFWIMTGNYWNHTSTLNNTQSAPNADGTVTYVVSRSDPGLHNWIDTEGLREPKLLIRWRLLPHGEARPALTTGGRSTSAAPAGTPDIRGELVKLADLRRVLPPDTRWVNAAQRQQQLAQRHTDFLTRFEV